MKILTTFAFLTFLMMNMPLSAMSTLDKEDVQNFVYYNGAPCIIMDSCTDTCMDPCATPCCSPSLSSNSGLFGFFGIFG